MVGVTMVKRFIECVTPTLRMLCEEFIWIQQGGHFELQFLASLFWIKITALYIGRWEEIVIRKSQERGWGILESARWAYSPQQFCLVIVGLPDGLIICNIVILCVSIKTRAFQITMFWTWHQGALLMIIYLLGALSSTKNNILSSWHGLVIAWAPSFNKMHVTYMLHCCHLFIIAPLPLPTR